MSAAPSRLRAKAGVEVIRPYVPVPGSIVILLALSASFACRAVPDDAKRIVPIGDLVRKDGGPSSPKCPIERRTKRYAECEEVHYLFSCPPPGYDPAKDPGVGMMIDVSACRSICGKDLDEKSGCFVGSPKSPQSIDGRYVLDCRNCVFE